MITIRDEGAKNKYRKRTIPLESSEVIWAFERLLERAASYGSASPHHYLFPFRESPKRYNPLKPMSDSGLKKQWDAVRVAADLKWLRPYDMRHTAITRMAENGVPIAIIMAFAGHMSLKMQQHYTTISMMAKRKAMASVWNPNSYQPGTYSTSNPQVTKKIG
jgi:integrase